MKYLLLLWLFTCMAFVLGGLTFRYVSKSHTIVNPSHDRILVEIDGLGVFIDGGDKWVIR